MHYVGEIFIPFCEWPWESALKSPLLNGGPNFQSLIWELCWLRCEKKNYQDSGVRTWIVRIRRARKFVNSFASEDCPASPRIAISSRGIRARPPVVIEANHGAHLPRKGNSHSHPFHGQTKLKPVSLDLVLLRWAIVHSHNTQLVSSSRWYVIKCRIFLIVQRCGNYCIKLYIWEYELKKKMR